MLAAAALTTLGALPAFLLSAESVLVRKDLDFSDPQLGLAVSAFFAAAALASLVAGSVVERIGRRLGTMVAGGLAAVSAGLIAVAADTYVALLVLLVVAGVANALLQMTANLTLATSVQPNRRGLAFGVKQSAVPVAILIGGLAVPTVGVLVGWRWSFGAVAAAAVLALLSGLWLPGTRSTRRSDRQTGDRPPPAALVVCFVSMTLASGALNSLGAFLPSWAYRVGLSPSTAGVLLAVSSGVSVVTRIVSGAVADRRRGRNLPVVGTYLTVGAVGFVLVSLDDVPMLVVGAVVAVGIGWAWPGLFLYAVVRVGRDSPAMASGAVQAGAFTGGAAGPALFGLLIAATTFPTAWRIAAGMLVASALLLVVARRMFLVDLVRRPPRIPLDAAPDPVS